MKIVRLLLIVFILLTTIGYFLIRYVLFPPNILESGGFQSQFINQTTEISRFGDGSVHIKTNNQNDVLFSLGFVHARDHLWQLQLAHIASNASISAYFGDDYIETDKFLQLLTYKSAETLDVSFLQPYADGINEIIERTDRRYPVQFTLANIKPNRWTALDVYQYFRIFTWLSDTNWQHNMALGIVNQNLPETLLPFFNEAKNIKIIDTEFHSGALNVLEQDKKIREFLNFPAGVAPIKSISGISHNREKPALFATHQSGSSRGNLWYPILLTLSNQQISGVTTPGLPIFFSGGNDSIAWSMITSSSTQALQTILYESISDTSHRLVTTLNGSQVLHSILVNNESLSNPFIFPFAVSEGGNSSSNCLSTLTRFPLLNESGLDSKACNMFVVNQNTGAEPTLVNGFNIKSSSVPDILRNIQDFKDETIYSSEFTSDIATIITNILNNNELTEEHRIFLSYLSNWNYIYDSNSVAASLFEIYLHHLTQAAIRTYLEDDDFLRLHKMGLLPRSFAIQLLKSHDNFLNRDAVFSPVNDAFLLRRVDETINYLKNLLGDDSFRWRWGKVLEYSVHEMIFCRNETMIHYPGRRVCDFTLKGLSTEISGGYLTLIPLKPNFSSEPRLSGLSTMLFLHDMNETNATSILSRTGVSGNPISPWYKNFGYTFQAPEMTIKVSSITITPL